MIDLPDPKQAPPIAWGILGAGGIAQKLATDIPAHTASSVVAVGSRSAERARDFAEKFDIGTAHGSYEDLVADDRVQAVYIASPHSEHRDHALLALAAGKPVLVEKAFTRNVAEAREVFAAADAAGLFAMEAMWTRFLPHMVGVRQVLDSGEIGEIQTLTANHGQRLDFGPEHRLHNPNLAGGALLDLGVYPVSFAYQVLGSPQQVHAVGQLTPTGVDASEAIVLRYEHAVASLTATLSARTRNDAVITGRDGRIEIEPTFYAETRVHVHPYEGESRSFAPAVPGGFEFQAAEAARCITSGATQSQAMSWDDTLAVLRTMDEIRAQLGVVYPGE